MNTDTENPLLTSVPGGVAERYYEALIGNSGHGVEVRLDAGGGRGKGVFATKKYDEGDIIFEERPLAAVQELDSKVDVATCSHCFRAVGTVEEHVGGKICRLINELSEAADQDDLQAVQDRVDKIHAAVDSRFLEGLLSGSVKLPLTDRVDMAQPVPCRAGCGDEYCSSACETQAWDSCHCLMCTVGQGDSAAAAASTTSSSDHKGKGKAAAPHQHQHNASRSHGSSSSRRTSSSRGSSSKKPKAVMHRIHGATVNRTALVDFFEHADDSNDIFRVAAQVVASTIIAADQLLQQQATDAADQLEAAAAYESAVVRASAGGKEGGWWQPVTALQRQQQQQQPESEGVEVQHACILADAAAVSAKSSSRALLPGHLHPSLQLQQQQDANQQPTEQQPSLGSTTHSSDSATPQEPYLPAMQAAFLPFALGHKIHWWNIPVCHHSGSTIAAQHSHRSPQPQPAAASDLHHSTAPGCQHHHADSSSGDGDGCCSHDQGGGIAHADNDDDAVDAVELSAQMRELAEDSLKLLRKAIRDDRFPQLFDIQLYGSLVGIFELNNLSLTVPAPVARYKHMLLHPDEAGLAAAEAAAALDEVRPLLEALGDEADAPAEGTGFYALQSCINHSCSPNAAAECLANGKMVIKALQAIPSGSEVLLSYIEEEGVGLYERRAMLRDYGFVCWCDRCTAEALADQLGQQNLTET